MEALTREALTREALPRGLLGLASCTERHVFKAHLRCNMCQRLTPLGA